jgi:hypothetical protein
MENKELKVAEELVDVMLSHSGILGMHWGQRRTTSKNRLRTVLAQPSADHKETRTLMNTKLKKSMTNEQLKKINTRLELEKKYSDLKPSAIKNGTKRMKTIVEAGTTLAALYAFSQSEFGKILINKIKSKMV